MTRTSPVSSTSCRSLPGVFDDVRDRVFIVTAAFELDQVEDATVQLDPPEFVQLYYSRRRA